MLKKKPSACRSVYKQYKKARRVKLFLLPAGRLKKKNALMDFYKMKSISETTVI